MTDYGFIGPKCGKVAKITIIIPINFSLTKFLCYCISYRQQISPRLFKNAYQGETIFLYGEIGRFSAVMLRTLRRRSSMKALFHRSNSSGCAPTSPFLPSRIAAGWLRYININKKYHWMEHIDCTSGNLFIFMTTI